MKTPALKTLLIVSVVAVCFQSAKPILAGTIANLTVTNQGSVPTFLDDPISGAKAERNSSVSLLSSNLTATMPTFSARLAAMAAADTEKPHPTFAVTNEARMRINFDIVAAPTESWTMQIGQLRRFALTLVDDPGSGFQSEAFIENHNATYSITPGPAGALTVPLAASEATPAQFGDLDLSGYAAVVDNVGGIGPASVQLDFEQRLRAISYANLDPVITVPAPGQEAAVRMGIAGTLPGVTAEDYPGVGGRTLANDGHFVHLKMTFVPEPASLALVGLMCAPLLIRRRRREM